ncbi:hypothetical protein [Poseidonibacter ostreae]|uniref:Uncharacterized protein n=1 Tax=Poseidonibacter ostreae TaxID=2654171 RepID=A0A6L4WY23_9BACT|nr:hypothetical protein [Poseidonibacter ostreae]KAB7891360.1 hypothetical protein GBG19_00560 [Poseidonibacter ostreae]
MSVFTYKEDKEKAFKALISQRKKDLGYLTPQKNSSSNICDECYFMESFSPSCHRCDLISYDYEYRITSINIYGVCDSFSKQSDENISEKYPKINYEDMGFNDVKKYIENKQKR